MTRKPTRRDTLAGIAALTGGIAASSVAAAATVTPCAAEGPFYPTPPMRHTDIDNDLVKIEGLVTRAGGEVIDLSGQLRDRDGNPLQGLRIEIWQCDVNGKYMHPGDDRNITHDTGFQGFGHDITDAEGRYRFRTIKPAQYPGRTPHIHVKVFDARGEVLTTQFYIKDDPGNARDALFRRMSTEEAEAVSMDFSDGPSATVDIVL